MAKLPKKFIKMAGGINKKAWQLFRSSKNKSSPRKGTTMAKNTGAKTVIRYRARPAAKTAPKKRRKYTLMSDRIMNPLINGGVIGVGAMGTTALINWLPYIKDQKTLIKALSQAGAGALGLFMLRNPWMKKLSTGAIVGSTITALLPWLKQQLPDVPIFTGMGARGNQLTPYQLSKLRQGNYSIRHMGPRDRMAGPWNQRAPSFEGPRDKMFGAPQFNSNSFKYV